MEKASGHSFYWAKKNILLEIAKWFLWYFSKYKHGLLEEAVQGNRNTEIFQESIVKQGMKTLPWRIYFLN